MEVEVDEKELKAAGAEPLPDGRRGLRNHGRGFRSAWQWVSDQKSKAQTRKVKSVWVVVVVVVVIVERSGGQQRKASKELQPSVAVRGPYREIQFKWNGLDDEYWNDYGQQRSGSIS
ncbi:hypothetical protein CMV_010183 [Castanea mollissima]|uniref:Uncharacterized protein n=1 Tax=Castanea mollissima TaxID=60419 RepID=A0A8J4R883_9ROSI|nr:hypothetical protein CMV_010183 [Castanea mollissima]